VHPDVSEVDARFRTQSDSASEAFASISQVELITMHQNFLKAIGGTITASQQKKKTDRYEKTVELIRSAVPLQEIAQQRKLTVQTIIDHIEKLAVSGRIAAADISYMLEPATLAHLKEIRNLFDVL